jgi:hypothetical protein
MDAIRKCLAEHGPATLRGSMLYTSGEPCAMCMGAILWCHVERLVFAASVTQLATKIDQIMLSSAEVAARAPFAPISITVAERRHLMGGMMFRAMAPRAQQQDRAQPIGNVRGTLTLNWSRPSSKKAVQYHCTALGQCDHASERECGCSSLP